MTPSSPANLKKSKKTRNVAFIDLFQIKIFFPLFLQVISQKNVFGEKVTKNFITFYKIKPSLSAHYFSVLAI